MTGAIALAVAFWMTRERNPVDQVALGCVLGGALGNILTGCASVMSSISPICTSASGVRFWSSMSLTQRLR